MVSTIIALIALGISIAAYLGYRHMWDQRDMREFTAAIKRVEHVLDRMELRSLVVASDHGVEREMDRAALAVIAKDLAESQDRADNVDGEPGEAADAGAQSGKNGENKSS